MLKKKFTILNVRKNQLNMVRAITPAIALKLIRFLLTMNWGGGGVWGLNHVLVPVSCIFIIAH